MISIKLAGFSGFRSSVLSFFIEMIACLACRHVMCKSSKIIFHQYAESGGTRIANSGHDGLLPQSRPNKVTYSTRTPVNNAVEQLRTPAGANELHVRELWSLPPLTSAFWKLVFEIRQVQERVDLIL